jgi:hypothetical protein
MFDKSASANMHLGTALGVALVAGLIVVIVLIVVFGVEIATPRG